jgi:hypothetical protein
MFKLIPSVEQGSWIIRQSVGNTPVLLGNKLKTEYHRRGPLGLPAAPCTLHCRLAYLPRLMPGVGGLTAQRSCSSSSCWLAEKLSIIRHLYSR